MSMTESTPQRRREPSVDDLRPQICRTARRALKWTFEEMSKKTEGAVHPAAIKEYEANRNDLTINARRALAAAIQATGLEIESRAGMLERRLERMKDVVFYAVLIGAGVFVLRWFFRY